MSDDAAMRQLVQQLHDELGRAIVHTLDVAGSESPIEALFAVAMVYGPLLMPPPFPCIRVMLCGVDELELAGGLDVLEIQLVPQFEEGLGWRADFLLQVCDGNGGRHIAIVECDGHEFHERTAEQAQRDRMRDREVQARGWRMLRFTGRELVKAPLRIVREDVIHGWAARIWFPQGRDAS